MGSKIRTFVELLNAGNTYEAAKAASEVSENTAKIQYSKLPKGVVMKGYDDKPTAQPTKAKIQGF